MAVSVKMKVDITGPLFQPTALKTFQENIRDLLQGMAEEGERMVKSAYPVVTGAGAAGVVGRVTSLSGKPWLLHATISQQHVYEWPDGGDKKYRGGKVGSPLFRRATSAIRVAKKDLTAGLS